MRRTIMAAALVLTLALVPFTLAACGGTSQASQDLNDAATKATTTKAAAWSPTSDCSKCHAAEVESLKDSTLLASKHSGQKCADCHNDADNLTKAHAGATGAPSSATTTASKMGTKEFCLKCHGTYEDLAAKTAASTVLKDTKGTVVNPHAVSQNADHQGVSLDECYNCHAVHQASAPAGPAVGAICITCHHENVFECHTCHLH